MIYTLTTNPAIDMNICTNSIERKLVNRTHDAVYSANGKGLNVSFVLKHFGVDSKVLGFFGGFSGKYIVEETKKKDIEILPVEVEDTTRINIFLNDGEGEFKFVNSGSFVDQEAQQEMLEKIHGLEDLNYLSISGSLPPGIETSYYEDIFKICQKKSTKVILDISSPKLKCLLKYKPFLIKPNDEEIADIFGIIVRDEEDIKDVLKYLHEQGAQNILLTLGEKGSYFYNGKNIYYASAHEIKLLSSACAGDSALAAFLSLWLQDMENEKNIEHALKRASATGANVAESNALGDFKKVKEYMNEIKVRRVE
ncbi:MAG: 1-phosphofructokinase family hexose kinase [Terrisporobacter sp.]|uniref:1-phosphofructokinase family hexose kinase n=1 Tax=Terrisporobacter sp. TaxID=1965305 RepID=UPI002FC58A25